MVSRSGPLRAVDVTTEPYPGFSSDLQAQLMALMAIAPGAAVIRETVFEGRFMHDQGPVEDRPFEHQRGLQRSGWSSTVMLFIRPDRTMSRDAATWPSAIRAAASPSLRCKASSSA